VVLSGFAAANKMEICVLGRLDSLRSLDATG
jgi:hypothetical protein